MNSSSGNFHVLFQVPQTTYKTPVEDDIISRIREDNRRKAEVGPLLFCKRFTIHTVGHFWVACCFCFKTSSSANRFL